MDCEEDGPEGEGGGHCVTQDAPPNRTVAPDSSYQPAARTGPVSALECPKLVSRSMQLAPGRRAVGLGCSCAVFATGGWASDLGGGMMHCRPVVVLLS